MSTPKDLSRRRILLLATGSVAALAAGATGCADSDANDRMLSVTSLDQALLELRHLTQAEPLPPATGWTWEKTLHHCAQSIEYSMSGFPQMRSKLFQRTVGGAAFKAFAWQGRMTHNLREAIPGAPSLPVNTDVAEAVVRLEHAVQRFSHWTKSLRPHFAYGELNKAQYEQAHAMHLANHFSAFRQKA